MLKKQTVWLLTMLSLMIVLSVYYLTSDKGDLAYIDSGQTDTEETAKTDAVDDEKETNSDASVEDNTNVNTDELFTTIRMELKNERSMKKDRLKEVVASNSATTEEKNEALNDINTLESLDTKEVILQD